MLSNTLHQVQKDSLLREVLKTSPESCRRDDGTGLPLDHFEIGHYRRVGNGRIGVLESRLAFWSEDDDKGYRRDIKVVFSTDRAALESLGGTDEFLRHEATPRNTPKALRYNAANPFHVLGDIQEIDLSGVPKPENMAGLPSKIFMRVYAEGQFKPYPKVGFSKPSPPKQEQRDKQESNTDWCGAYDFSTEFNYFPAVGITKKPLPGLCEVPAELWPESGASIPFVLSHAKAASPEKTDDGSIPCVVIRAAYGIPEADGKAPTPLFERETKVYCTRNRNALEAMANGNKNDIMAYSYAGGRTYYLLPCHSDTITRTSNKVPKLSASLGNEQALISALERHFDLRNAYKSGQLLLPEGVELKNLRVESLSGGRSGQEVCSLTAALAASEEIQRQHEWDEDFQSALQNGVTIVAVIANNERQRARAEHNYRCLEILHNEGFPVPAPRKTKSFFAEDTDQSVMLYEYIRGRHSDKLDYAHLASLGEALGKLHASGIEFPEAPESMVVDDDILLDDARWAMERIEHPLPGRELQVTKDEMVRSIRQELLNRFPSWEVLVAKAPDLCIQLGLDKKTADIHYAVKGRKQKDLDRLPKSSSCWNDAHRGNIVLGENGRITMLDFQNTGEGIPVIDLEVASFFTCVNEQGELDPAKMRAFFVPYITARNAMAKEKGTLPFTKEELCALPRLLLKQNVGRELAVAAMFREKIEQGGEGYEEYVAFNRRMYGLREQMKSYLTNGIYDSAYGASRFAEDFLGMDIDHFPKMSEVLAQRERVEPTAREGGQVGDSTQADNAARKWSEAVGANTEKLASRAPAAAGEWAERVRAAVKSDWLDRPF